MARFRRGYLAHYDHTLIAAVLCDRLDKRPGRDVSTAENLHALHTCPEKPTQRTRGDFMAVPGFQEFTLTVLKILIENELKRIMS